MDGLLRHSATECFEAGWGRVRKLWGVRHRHGLPLSKRLRRNALWTGMWFLIHNFINFAIAILIVLYVIFSDDESPELCYLHYQTSIPANNVSFESIGILSVVRYYIAWKTQNNETPKEKLIIGTTILIFCLEHIVHYPLAYLATEYFDLPSLVTMCNSETLQGSLEVVG